MSVTPDLEGFVDSQRRLRSNFGELVTFHMEPSLSWPSDVPIDPETQKPYDPVLAAAPLSSDDPTTTVKCNVVFKAVNRAGISGEAQAGPLGWMESADIMLIADITDRGDIDGALTFDVRDESWEVHATLVDGVGGEQRYLVFGRKK